MLYYECPSESANSKLRVGIQRFGYCKRKDF